MAKTSTQIIARALTLLDEQVTVFATAATTEMSMSDVAAEVLPEVCRNLVKELPYELKRYLATTAVLVPEVLATGEVQIGVKRKVAFVTPSDFWELVAIRLSVWSNPVYTYIKGDSLEYNKQNNPFTRGGKQNPVVVLSNSGASGASRIECFSVHNTDEVVVTLFEYVAFSNVPGVTTPTWPDELFELVTEALASKLMLIKQRTQEAAIVGSEGEKIIEQHK